MGVLREQNTLMQLLLELTAKRLRLPWITPVN